MKYVNQKAYPHWLYVTRTDPDAPEHERGKTTTVASSGCGLCSSVMVADRLIPNCDFDLTAAISLSYEVKANHGPGTDYKLFAPAFAKKMGLKLEVSADIEDLHRCLRTGGAAVVLVYGDREGNVGVFAHGKHYMAVVGEELDGRLAILDPSYSKEKYDTDVRRDKVEFKHGVLLLSDAEILARETNGTAVGPYFLFWRQ